MRSSLPGPGVRTPFTGPAPDIGAHERGQVVDVEVDASRAAPVVRASPNPFHSGTSILFRLARPGPVRATVIDVKGRTVKRLAVGPSLTAGEHALRWDGRDDEGRRVPAGLYFVQLSQPRSSARIKLIVLD